MNITATRITAYLEVSGLIDGNNWEYNGEVEFKQASLPSHGMEQENGFRLIPYAHLQG